MPTGPQSTRGRGATVNPQGRFESLRRTPEDDGWYGGDGEPPALHTVVTFERARSIIVRNRSPDVPFDLSINPYRGCEHGCVYCCARPNHGYVGLSPGLDFETRLFAKADAAELLRRELAAPAYRCEPINLGSSTDAYQPIEREHRITREIVEVLERARHPVSVITKSALIERDLDLWASLARDRLVFAFVSITTLDPGLARLWEPRAAAPWRRLETIRRLSEVGVAVGVSVAPIAPFINEPELESVLAAARDAGARRAQYMVLRLPAELVEIFSAWLRAHFPDRADRVLNRLREMRAGKGEDVEGLNDPRFFSRMKGSGKWAELLAMRFDLAMRKLAMQRGRLELRTDLFAPPRSDGQLVLFEPDPHPR
ncbi:MAG: PA0069 family radical SAM protein [Burkholderiaceae bacterium]|nr:PA0069 family radical SAM protein [Burkholderiaceae bacterium]